MADQHIDDGDGERYTLSKRFGYSQEGFKSWLLTRPHDTWNFSSIFHPLATYICDIRSTLFAEVTLDYYWVSGKGYTRRGPLPEWAYVMNTKLAEQVGREEIPYPFTTSNILTVLED
jgi:hypothetical protein